MLFNYSVNDLDLSVNSIGIFCYLEWINNFYSLEVKQNCTQKLLNTIKI